MKKIVLLFTCLLYLIILSDSIYVRAQNVNGTSTNNLSDGQIKELMQQGQANGLSDDQIVQNAVNKGLPASQSQSLLQRMTAIRNNDQNTSSNSNSQQTTGSRNYTPDTTHVKSAVHSPIFGADLFRNSNSTFEPNLRLATPVNYILGPDDELDISVYGQSIVNWKLTVSPEGNINLPRGGILNVAGKTIETASALIKQRLVEKNYAIGHGSEVKITLGDIRSIKVIMVGEVSHPGTYTLPSLATAFNALYAAGGPNDNGSFRSIEIIRNNRVIRHLDIYDFLVKGDQKDNIGLQDQDIIRVPTYNVRVEVTGEVKNPGFFETLPGETLADVIKFAGGFNSLAYRGLINVSQISERQRRVTDVTEENFKNYIPLPGDRYIVERILERYENRIFINGAVFRAGQYELQKGLMLSQLITRAGGLTEDAFTGLGTITRLNADNSTELISFNVANVVNNSFDLPLQREDVVNIRSKFDLHDQYSVKISGDVRSPGDFPFADNMKIQNLILMAGGFSDGASTKRVEVARRIYNSDPSVVNSATAKVYSFDIDSDLMTENDAFTLKPYDIVLVYNLPGYEKQGVIHVEGEVTYPGPYIIEYKNEKISDIIKKAGGLTAAANAEGSTLKRSYVSSLGIDKTKADTAVLAQEHNERINQLKRTFRDTTVASEDFRNNFIGIDLDEIIKKPGSATDLIVKDGDVIRIPQQQQVVQLNGEVHVPSGVVYTNGKSFNAYVIDAGGYADDAAKKGAYVIYANGSVKGTHNFLFFRSHPEIKPGSEIFIPKKPVRHGFNFAELAGVVSAVGTTVILAIISFRH